MNNKNCSLVTGVMRIFVMPATRLAWLVGLLWSGVMVLQAADRYVSLLGTNDAAGGYTNWAGAATNIEWAVDVATNTESVCVSNGTYYLTNQIVITNAITLYSLKGRDETIVNGNFPAYSNRCFWISNVNALITGFTITNGYVTNQTDAYGGGAYLQGGCISNCIITGNTVTNFTATARGGGGVYCFSANAANNPRDSRIDSCRIVGNKVMTDSTAVLYSGGGGAYLRVGTMLTNCEVSGNFVNVSKVVGGYAGGGGVAIYGNGEIYNCLIISNRTDVAMAYEAGGAGVWICNGVNAKLINSVISGNTNTTGGTGGGVNMLLPAGTIQNCLISGNGINASIVFPFDRFANGLAVWGKGTVENCTIMDNNGSGRAGVCFNEHAAYWPMIFINTIIQSNYTGGVLTNWYFSDSTYLFLTNCCIYPTSFPANVQSSGCITSSPQVVDSAGGNYRLSPNSPCINAGINQSWMTNGVDLDGRKRIQYGTVDMGAYERINKGAIFSVH